MNQTLGIIVCVLIAGMCISKYSYFKWIRKIYSIVLLDYMSCNQIKIEEIGEYASFRSLFWWAIEFWDWKVENFFYNKEKFREIIDWARKSQINK